MVLRRLNWAILCGATLAPMFSLSASAAADPWSWLKGTTWFVPQSGLLALASRATQAMPVQVSDQTVYTILGYRAGYFWGVGVTANSFLAPCLS